MAHLMKNLTPEELKFLCSKPPYGVDLYDLVEQHFGDTQPEWVWDFVSDLKNLGENWAKVLTARGELKC